MKSTTPTRIASLLALAALAPQARADVLNVLTSGDGYIRASQTAVQTNNTANAIFLVGDGSATDELRAVLNFDLSNPLLTGATINSVTLNLVFQQVDGTSLSQTETLQLHHLTESFVEASTTWTTRDGSVSWTNAGGTFGSLLQTFDMNPRSVTTNQAFSFGTSAAFESVTSSAIGGNLGLMIKIADVNASRSIFRILSEESVVDVGFRPYLTITYSIPEPSSFAVLAGVAAVGFAASRRRRSA